MKTVLYNTIIYTYKEGIMLAEKEVRLVAQARNNRLYHLINENEKWSRCGKPSVAAFSRDVGVDEVAAGKLLNLRMFPICKAGSRSAGQYTSTAQRIADYFDLPVEYVFPLHLYRRVINSFTAVEVSLAQLPYVEKMMIGNEHAHGNIASQKMDRRGGISNEK
jgi:hypothetical protein